MPVLSSLLPMLRLVALDANGAPMGGALLYTYAAGGTTNLATYSDAALTVQNANPVVANSAGVFGPIYLTSAAYRFDLKSAAGVTYYTQDNVSNGLPISGGTLLGDLLFTDALYDIGKSGATRPRDVFLSRDLTVGRNLVPGTVNADLLFTDALYDIGKSAATRPRDAFLSRDLTVGRNLTPGTVVADVLFTDALYDIGKSGATRPRDVFLSRNLTVGGTIGATGAATLTAGFTANANCTINGTGSAATNLTISTATTGSPGFSLSNATTGVLAQFQSTNSKDFSINVNAGNTFGIEIAVTGAWRGRLYGAGTATFDASGNVTSVSDERLKDRIAPFTHGLLEVLALRPIQHGWNEQSGLERDHLYAGFNAQEVEQVMPIAVGQNADGMRSLSDRAIIAALVNAVKTLTARIDQLEGQIR